MPRDGSAVAGTGPRILPLRPTRRRQDYLSRFAPLCDNSWVIVDSALYVDGKRVEGRLALGDVPNACLRPDAFVWLGLYEPTEEEFESVRAAFDLHELAVEDAVKAHQRPKLEVYDDSLFLVLRTARYLDVEEQVEFGEILVFVGEHFLVHVRHGEATALSSV